MANNQSMNNSQKVAILSIGIVLATGFAWWNISQALGPSAPSGNTPNPATPTTTPPAGQAEIGSVVPRDSAAQPDTAAVNTQAAAGTHPAANSEMFLAPLANPFAGMPQTPVSPNPVPPAGPAAPAPASAAVSKNTGNAPLVGNVSLPGLPHAVNPRPLLVQPVSGPNPGQMEKDAANLFKVPELAGTMLGNRPSAVFRGASQLIVVPVGGMIDGWRVITVHHGEVLLRNGKQTLHMGTGLAQAQESETQPTEEPALPPNRSIQFSSTAETVGQTDAGQSQGQAVEPVAAAKESDHSLPAVGPADNSGREVKQESETGSAVKIAPPAFNPFEDAAPRANPPAAAETKAVKSISVSHAAPRSSEPRRVTPTASTEPATARTREDFQKSVGFLSASLGDPETVADTGHKVVSASVSHAASAHRRYFKHLRWHRHRHHHHRHLVRHSKKVWK